jgi:alkenylglycerophosphocholine hydrolase
MNTTVTLMKNNWSVLFWLLSLTFILSSYNQNYSYSGLLKVFPIFILIFTVKGMERGLVPLVFVFGLVFSSFGDFILDYDRQGGFIYGLAAFFIAHLFYIFSMGKWKVKKGKLLLGISYIIYGLIIIGMIYPNLGELKLAVIGYMIVLLLMGLTTLFCTRSNLWLIAGGISFVLSDSLIGIDKFYTEIPLSAILIMLSYYFAQYALVRGIMLKQQQFNRQ